MYRDGLEGLREAVLVQRTLVVERATAFGGVKRVMLPDDHRASIARYESVVANDPTTLEEISALGATLDDLTALLDELEPLATGLVAFADGAPAFDPSEEPLYPNKTFDDFGDEVRRVTAPYGGVVRHWGDGYGVVVEHEGTKLLVRVTLAWENNATHTPFVARVLTGVWAYVPEALPRITLRPQTIKDGIAKVLGLSHEIDVGEPRFDGQFWLSGREDAVRAVFTTAVMDAVSRLAPLDPTIIIDRGLAKIAWMVDGGAFLDPRGGLDVLCAIRRLGR